MGYEVELDGGDGTTDPENDNSLGKDAMLESPDHCIRCLHPLPQSLASCNSNLPNSLFMWISSTNFCKQAIHAQTGFISNPGSNHGMSL